MGRVAIIATVQDLSVDDLIRILTEPKSSIVSQYKQMFALDDVSKPYKKKIKLVTSKLIPAIYFDLHVDKNSDIKYWSLLIHREKSLQSWI